MIQVRVYYELEEGEKALDVCVKFKTNFAELIKLNPDKSLINVEFGHMIRIQ